MTGFEADAAHFYAAAHGLRTIVDEGNADLSRLAALADNVTGEHWHGAAASRFASAFQEWQVAARRGLGALEDDARALDQAGRDYQTSDDDGASRIDAAGRPA